MYIHIYIFGRRAPSGGLALSNAAANLRIRGVRRLDVKGYPPGL